MNKDNRRENSMVNDKIIRITELIEEDVEPYVLEHMGELDDDWTEDDLREIEETFEDVKSALNYLKVVVDAIDGINF